MGQVVANIGRVGGDFPHAVLGSCAIQVSDGGQLVPNDPLSNSQSTVLPRAPSSFFPLTRKHVSYTTFVCFSVNLKKETSLSEHS